MARSHRERPQGAVLSHSRFLNRQNLYLRPDPARVVVRPFRPATEPRDLNPTDRTRANHIVERVLRLDADSAARQLSDVVENFQGRHRNLLEIFETRAADMEEAFDPHAELNQTQRRLIGAHFLHEYSFEASATEPWSRRRRWARPRRIWRRQPKQPASGRGVAAPAPMP